MRTRYVNVNNVCFPICSPIFFYLAKLIGTVRMFPTSDIHGANAQWTAARRLLLQAFIAFRIETPSGNIFPRANLIKARRTGLLNEQTVTVPQHAAATARCSDSRKGTSRWRREVSKCNFMPQFFSFYSCRRALRHPPRISKYLPQEESLIFQAFSRWFRSGEINSSAKRARRVRNIY